MKMKNNRGFTLIELLVVITIIAILASLSMPVFSKIQEQGNIAKGTNNVRQIFLAISLYASDNDGSYPDSNQGVQTANDAFRILVEDQLVDKEEIFGCPGSAVGNPDGNLGESPDFNEAVGKSENHWMMTGSLTNSSGGNFPVLFENALEANNNPRWDAGAAGTIERGRTWSGGKVIICTNDGSVGTERTESKDGPSPLKALGDSDKNLFERVRISKVLDIEE